MRLRRTNILMIQVSHLLSHSFFLWSNCWIDCLRCHCWVNYLYFSSCRSILREDNVMIESRKSTRDCNLKEHLPLSSYALGKDQDRRHCFHVGWIGKRIPHRGPRNRCFVCESYYVESSPITDVRMLSILHFGISAVGLSSRIRLTNNHTKESTKHVTRWGQI